MNLPTIFQEYIACLASRNNNANRAAQATRRELLSQLEAWRKNEAAHQIPGYTIAPLNAPGKPHPYGWSLSNFTKIIKAASIAHSTIKMGKPVS